MYIVIHRDNTLRIFSDEKKVEAEEFARNSPGSVIEYIDMIWDENFEKIFSNISTVKEMEETFFRPFPFHFWAVTGNNYKSNFPH